MPDFDRRAWAEPACNNRFPEANVSGRILGGSPNVSLDMLITMMAWRCEYQIRADWDLLPGLFSLGSAARVNDV